MGNQVIANTDEMRSFAFNLRNLSNDLIDSFAMAKKQMYTVNETWQDKENTIFMAEFEKSLSAIEQMADLMQEYSNYVDRKAEQLEVYLHNTY
ncbi:WXG100 family type VII secretion target [Parabacteroides distasonis]|uniref:WXG100 family type VII secretion target n=1 Tax=Parabacteroides distasonis TaxID=823 RepID=UPI00189E4BFB|nr:WXG100 family type VII secretion target [Parabacteroides distasonis]MDB9153867.1 WXG100 family type VII secretion target [Parabacteroides distasonis]MDB9158286.1 WXG100 family type VII secretion target [Parabacteroides distasonis]MDB9167102.1 WXG100 family type VII secretion target [Parabacteroides distasonis]MDB9171571.1 WXG100 family type VII secretion target [Parabacteroides distasonis]MDB9193906.1 WXG100 family type VII secretion target [Parabacteroides distasonis]